MLAMTSPPKIPFDSLLPAMPSAGWTFPVALSGSTSVVLPPNVNPIIGVMCHSAAAGTAAPHRHSQDRATIAASRTPALRRELEEEIRKQRPGHVAGGQV